MSARAKAVPDIPAMPRDWSISDRDFWIEQFSSLLSNLTNATLEDSNDKDDRLPEDERERVLKMDIELAARGADEALVLMQARFQGRTQTAADRRRRGR